MDQTYDTSQLDQSALQNLLGGSTPSLIPESLITTLTVGFIVLNVLGILFMIFYIFSIVRKWRVESAMLHMQKDVAEIKTLLENHRTAAPVPASQPVAPAAQNNVIANQPAAANDNQLS